MFPLMPPGVISEVMILLMPLPLFTVHSSANLPLQSIRILLELSTAGYGLLALSKSSFLIGILSSIKLQTIPCTALVNVCTG